MTRSVASARTVAGSRTTAQTRYPSTLSGLLFSGTVPFVSVTNNAVLQSLTALTFEAFFYFNSISPAYNARIVSYFSGNAGFDFRISIALQTFSTHVGNGTTNVNPLTIVKMNLNAWNHVAFTWDGTTVRNFVNGTLSGTAALSGGNTGNPAINLTLGNGTQAPQGVLSEVRISNNARYTSSFTAPTLPFVPDANTVALWHTLEGTGTTIGDSSGNSLTGTLSGSSLPLWTPGYYHGSISARGAA